MNKYTVIILLLPPQGKSFLKKCRNGAKMPRIPQGMQGKSMDRDKNSGGGSIPYRAVLHGKVAGKQAVFQVFDRPQVSRV